MKKTLTQLAESLTCGIYATKADLTTAFSYAHSFNDHAVTTAVHVVVNTIAKELLNIASTSTPVPSNDRQKAMVELMNVVTDEFSRYEEGLTTDLECTRSIVTNALDTFTVLEKCSKCGKDNDGNHFETYSGNICTDCNPDKRVFTVSYGVGFPVTAPVLKYRHQLVLFEGLSRTDEANIDTLNPGEMADCHLVDNRRIHVMRTR